MTDGMRAGRPHLENHNFVPINVGVANVIDGKSSGDGGMILSLVCEECKFICNLMKLIIKNQAQLIHNENDVESHLQSYAESQLSPDARFLSYEPYG